MLGPFYLTFEMLGILRSVLKNGVGTCCHITDSKHIVGIRTNFTKLSTRTSVA